MKNTGSKPGWCVVNYALPEAKLRWLFIVITFYARVVELVDTQDFD